MRIHRPITPIEIPIETLARKVSEVCASNMIKLQEGLNTDQIEFIAHQADKTIQKTGLAEKGVEIVRLGKDAIKKTSDKTVTEIVNGNNAAYFPQLKKILMPKDKLPFAVFHEIGHAFNDNKSMLGKLLQQGRKASILVAPISFIAFSDKPSSPYQPENKVTAFVQRNAGKLTFLTFLPTLLEEGLASLRGSKYAKDALTNNMAEKILPKNILKNVNQSYGFAFATYLVAALATTLSVSLGVKYKERMKIHRQKLTYDYFPTQGIFGSF